MKRNTTELLTEIDEIDEIGDLNLHNNPSYMHELISARVLTRLRNIMEEENLSVNALAMRLKTSRQHLAKLLNEEIKLSLKFLIKIGIALDYDIDIRMVKRKRTVIQKK